ncbi:MAG TPA: ATP-binding cassette domain-containing protein, partial [Burkholderiales bacterium]|nr:ATP-binding cassette domain-containing protein [Burkholderiales bacterium]
TTLLKLILGELAPDSGSVRLGGRLSVAYYDQFRAQLDEEATVLDSVGQGADYVEVGGERKHIMTYLADFLFSPQRVRSPVKSLSGGERNRLLLARLFTRPANLLVLDEPTNDLDIETLELLEDLLQSYEGTVLLVSHDRTFLDNVVTQVIAWDGEATWLENPGGYEEWGRVQSLREAQRAAPEPQRDKPAKRAPPPRTQRPARLSFKEARELEALPGRIEALEREQAELGLRLADPALYRSDALEVKRVKVRYAQIDGELSRALERWTDLEQRDRKA